MDNEIDEALKHDFFLILHKGCPVDTFDDVEDIDKLIDKLTEISYFDMYRLQKMMWLNKAAWRDILPGVMKKLIKL